MQHTHTSWSLKQVASWIPEVLMKKNLTLSADEPQTKALSFHSLMKAAFVHSIRARRIND
jgi:hypothetical protein